MRIMARVLVIDDEEAVLSAVQRRLVREGHDVATAAEFAEGIRLIDLANPPYDVVVTDMSMDLPEAGLQVLHHTSRRDLYSEVIVMTAYGTIANAVECMRRGAFDYIEKNVPGQDAFEVLVEKIELALTRRRETLS